jgi:hypothetical protein
MFRVPLAAILLLPLLAGEELRVGRAAVKITPPAGIPMAGYYNIRLAEGTLDDLWAKAIAFEVGGRTAVLTVCDLVSLPSDIAANARRQAEAATGIPASNLFFSATHSHTGPLLGGRALAFAPPAARKMADSYRVTLAARMAEAAKLAASSLTPAKLSMGAGREESVSFYRRFLMKDGSVKTNPGKKNPEVVQPMGQIDPDVAVLWAESADGKPLAAMVNHALHLDTVGGLQFSADYPYTLSKILATLHGPGLITQFTIGAAGNINHIDVKSAEPQKGPGEARRIGTVLAGEVIKTLTRMTPVAAASLQVRSETVRLPLPNYTPEEVEKARAAAAAFGKPGSPGTVPLAEAFRVLDVAERKGAPIETEVGAIALGQDLALVMLPGEIFVELGTAIKKASPFRQTVIVELSGGNIGYVPTRKAFSEGGYEVLSARFAPGGGEMLADAAIRIVAALHRDAAR